MSNLNYRCLSGRCCIISHFSVKKQQQRETTHSATAIGIITLLMHGKYTNHNYKQKLFLKYCITNRTGLIMAEPAN